MSSNDQYNGPQSRGDWPNARLLKRVADEPQSYDEIQAHDDAFLANAALLQAKNILKQQLPLFRLQGGYYSRTYGGDLLVGITPEGSLALKIITNTGLELKDIKCECAFGDYTNMQSLCEAVVAVRPLTQATGLSEFTKKIRRQDVMLSLTPEQYTHLTQFYTAKAGFINKGPGLTP